MATKKKITILQKQPHTHLDDYTQNISGMLTSTVCRRKETINILQAHYRLPADSKECLALKGILNVNAIMVE